MTKCFLSKASISQPATLVSISLCSHRRFEYSSTSLVPSVFNEHSLVLLEVSRIARNGNLAICGVRRYLILPFCTYYVT